MNAIFDSANRCVGLSPNFGVPIPDDLIGYPFSDLTLVDGVVTYDPVTETLGAAKRRGTAVVQTTYPTTAAAPVADSGNTYSYLPAEILGLVQTHTTTANVTVTCTLIASPYTVTTPSITDAAFQVIVASVITAVQAVITRYQGYLTTIAAASTVGAVNAVLAELP